MIPIGLLAIIAAVIGLTVTNAEAQGPQPTTTGNPWLPIDSQYMWDLDIEPYTIEIGLENPTLENHDGNICVLWPNGDIEDCYPAGEQNILVEPLSGDKQGTGTIWSLYGKCWFGHQLWVRGEPIEVSILKVDDLGGESPIWCIDQDITLIPLGATAQHNGQEVAISSDGKVTIDGQEFVTSGVSTCGGVIEHQSGSFHRVERFTELSPGSRDGLLHPSALLLGKGYGYELLNRFSPLGIWTEIMVDLCPPPVEPTETLVPPTATHVPCTTDGNSSHGICLPIIVNHPTPTATATPRPTPAPTCPAQFGFGDDTEPTNWYALGEDYPTQPAGRDLWVKLLPIDGYYMMKDGRHVDMSGNSTPLGDRYPGAQGHVGFTFEYVPNVQPAAVVFTLFQRVNNADRFLCTVSISIDDIN